MTCQHQVKAVEIDDSLVGDDKEMLEDSDHRRVQRLPSDGRENGAGEYSGMASGLNLPPGMKLPF